MKRLYRVLVSAVPAPFDVWLRAHEAELVAIETRRGRATWSLGLIPLAFATFARIITRSPRSLVGGTLMRTIVGTLSVVNVLAGVGLVVLYLVDTNPSIVIALALALILQGGYTLVLLGDVFGQRHALARRIELVGSTLALVVGSVGVLIGVVTNLAANAVEPEYGPMTVAFLIAVHGLFSLAAFGGHGTDVPTTSATA